MDKDKYDQLFDEYFKGAIDIMKHQTTNSLIQSFTEKLLINYASDPETLQEKLKLQYIADIDTAAVVLQHIQDDISKREESTIVDIITKNEKNKEVPKDDKEIQDRIDKIIEFMESFIVEYYDLDFVLAYHPEYLELFEKLQLDLLEKEFTDQVKIIIEGLNSYLIHYGEKFEEPEIEMIYEFIKKINLPLLDRDEIIEKLIQKLKEEFETYERDINKTIEHINAFNIKESKKKLLKNLQETLLQEIASFDKNLIHDLRAGYMISNILCGVLGYRFFVGQLPEIINKKKLKNFSPSDTQTIEKLDLLLENIESAPNSKEYLQSLLFEKSEDYFALEKIKPEYYYKHSKEEYYLGNFLSNTATEQKPALDNIYTMLHKLKGTQPSPSIDEKELEYVKLYGCNVTAGQGKNFKNMKIKSFNNSSFINTNLKNDKFDTINFNNTSFNSHPTSFITKLKKKIEKFNSEKNVKLDMGDIFGLYAYPLSSRNNQTILENANFDGCIINNCTFKDIIFTSCSVNSGTKFNNCSFSKCNINFVIKDTLELTDCTFIECKFSNKDIGLYKFNKCNFFGPKTREMMLYHLFSSRLQSGYYYRNFNTYPGNRSILGFYISNLNLAAMDLFEFTNCKFHNMYFEHVRFSENTKFDGCTFIDSHFTRSVIITRLRNDGDPDGPLPKTTFTKNCKFFNCNLTHCSISYPNYNPATNSLIEEGTTFDNCNLQFFANTSKANQFNEVFLRNITQYTALEPRNAPIDYYRSFKDANLTNIDFTKCNMSCNQYIGTEFRNCKLDNADFALRADRFGMSIFSIFSNKTRFINTSLKGANLFCVQGFGNDQEQLLNTELRPRADIINDYGLILYDYNQDNLKIRSDYLRENVVNFVTEKGVSDKLTGVNFRAVDLTGAIFGLDEENHCNLKACSFLEADLNYTTFTGIEADEIENCDFTRLLGYPRRDNFFVIEEETIDAIQNNNAATEVHARTKFYMGNIDLKSVTLTDDSPEDSKNIVSIMFKNIPYSVVDESNDIKIFPEMNKSNIENKIITATNSIEKEGCIPFIPTSELNGRLEISEKLIQLFVNHLGSANDEATQIQFLKDLHKDYFAPLIELAKNVDETDQLTGISEKYKDVFVRPDPSSGEKDHFSARSLVVSTLQKKIDRSDKPDKDGWDYSWYQVVIIPMIYLVYQPIKYIKIWLEGFILGITTAYAIQADNKYGMSCAPGILGRLISEHTGTMGVVNDLIELDIQKLDVNSTTFKLQTKLPEDVIDLIKGKLLDLDDNPDKKIEHYVQTLRYDYFQIMMKLEPNTSYPTNLIIEDLIKSLPYVESDLTFFISTKWAEMLTDDYNKDNSKFNTLTLIVNHFKESARSKIYTDTEKSISYNQIYDDFIKKVKDKGKTPESQNMLEKIAKQIVAKEKLRINVALRAGKKIIKQTIWGFYGKDPSEELILDEDESLADPVMLGGGSDSPSLSNRSDTKSSDKDDDSFYKEKLELDEYKEDSNLEDSSPTSFDTFEKNRLNEHYCIRQFLLFIKNSVENIRKNQPDFFTNIEANKKDLSIIDSLEIPERVESNLSGSEWYCVGMEMPIDGVIYDNTEVKTDLQKSEFTYVNLKHEYKDINPNSYVEVETRYGVEYFIPVERSQKLALQHYKKLYDLFESLSGSSNNLIYILDKDEPPIFGETLEESLLDIYDDLLDENDELKYELKIVKETLSKELEELPESIQLKIEEYKKLPELIKQHIEIESDNKIIEILEKDDEELKIEIEKFKTQIKEFKKPSDKQRRKKLIKHLKRLTELRNLKETIKLINNDEIINPNILHYLLAPFIKTQFTDHTKYIGTKKTIDKKLEELLNAKMKFYLKDKQVEFAQINEKSNNDISERKPLNITRRVRNAIGRTARATNAVGDVIRRRTARAARAVTTFRDAVRRRTRRSGTSGRTRRSRRSRNSITTRRPNLPLALYQNKGTDNPNNKSTPREEISSESSSLDNNFKAGNKITLNNKKGGKKMNRSILNSKKTIKKFKKY